MKVVNGSTLQVAVSEMTPGTKITLGVIRNGKSETLNLTVGQYHGKSEVASNDSDDEHGSGSAKTGKLGLAVANLTADARRHLNAPDQLHGVLVQSVRPASPAEDAGIQPGDVILEVNRKPAESASQFSNEVHQQQEGKDILLLVWSRGGSTYRIVHTDQGSENQGNDIGM
jgi:serine protease Do